MDDQQLRLDLARYRATGDASALSGVFEQALGQLLPAALRAVGSRDAADLVQTTCVHAIANLAAFDDERPILPWLLGILHNRAHALRRDRARTPDTDRLPNRAPTDPLSVAAAKERADLVRASIANLPERQRQAMTLRWLNGLPVSEIAVVD